jgi:hypothetical protein
MGDGSAAGAADKKRVSRRRHHFIAAVLVVAIGSVVESAGAKPPDQAPGQSAPFNTSAPVVAGSAVSRQSLAADPGSWSGPTPTFAFQWQRCNSSGGSCSSIADATASGYMVGAADVGATLAVTVTASNKNGSAAATSSATAVVQAPVVASPPPVTTTTQPTTTTANTTTTPPTTTTTPPTTTTTTTTPPPTTTQVPTTGQPSGFHWLADYRNANFIGQYGDGVAAALIPDDMHLDQTVNDPSVGVTKGNTVVPKPVPGYSASAYSNRVVVSAGFNQTGSLSGASTTIWGTNYYSNPWEQNGAKTWFRIRVLFPDGSDPTYPGAFHPEANLSAGWDIFGEWHMYDAALAAHGGRTGGAAGSTNLGIYRWTVGGTANTPCLLFRPANSYWLLETDQTQTKADSILNGAAQPRGAVQPLRYNHWYDFLVYQELSPNASTGYMEIRVDGNLRFADHLATMPQAADGTVPGLAFESGLYRSYEAGQPNDIIYQGPMIAGPTRASVGS